MIAAFSVAAHDQRRTSLLEKEVGLLGPGRLKIDPGYGGAEDIAKFINDLRYCNMPAVCTLLIIHKQTPPEKKR